jgi:hypothetical protein
MLRYENLRGAPKWNLRAAPSRKNTRFLIGPKPAVSPACSIQLWIAPSLLLLPG